VATLVVAFVISVSQQEESAGLQQPGTFLRELARLWVQRAKRSCWSHPRRGATLQPGAPAPPTGTLSSSASSSYLLASSRHSLERRQIGKGEGFFLKKKKERSCEKLGKEEGMQTSFLQEKDAVAAILCPIRQVIT